MTRYEALGETALLLITLLGVVGAATAGLLLIEGLRALKQALHRYVDTVVETERLLADQHGPALSRMDRRDGLGNRRRPSWIDEWEASRTSEAVRARNAARLRGEPS